MHEFVTIATFTLPHEASILAARLEDEGIETYLRDELTVQQNNFYSHALGGVKLQVRENDVENALKIMQGSGYIGEHAAKEISDSAAINSIDEKKQKKIKRIFIFVFVLTAILTIIAYISSRPTMEELLTRKSWNIEEITFDSVKVHAATRTISIAWKNHKSEGTLIFFRNGEVSLPGVGGSSENGQWIVDEDRILIHGLGQMKKIFEGIYSIKIDGNELVLRSRHTVIRCTRMPW
ncbi:MAG: DUF2007 domain-containing protein [Bacteroidetes bacterium]|nr:DUF2007 domain-containing protein [Bacteroidota bacterium]